MERESDNAGPARRHPRRGLHLGLGRTDLHDAARPHGGRGHSNGVDAPGLHTSYAAAVAGRPAGSEPLGLLQPVQPGEAQHSARHLEAGGSGDGEADRGDERRRCRELRF